MIRVCLMNQDSSFRLRDRRQASEDSYFEDLSFPKILEVISQNDSAIDAALDTALHIPLFQADEINFRQDALSDCIRQQNEVRELYTFVRSTLESQKQSDWQLQQSQTVSRQFECGLAQLRFLVDALQALRNFSDTNHVFFQSHAFTSLFYDIQNYFDTNFFNETFDLIRELTFPCGILVGARLSTYGGISDLRLLSSGSETAEIESGAGVYRIAEGDSSAALDILHRREIIKSEANRPIIRAVIQITDFFNALHTELAFYIGCLNLIDLLHDKGIDTCIPAISMERYGEGIVELNMALENPDCVKNDLNLSDCNLCIITGADQGGKSAFLHAIGQAQLLLQCGMPVAAKMFCAPIVKGFFTHFQKDEDRSMRNGKLNEELIRMSRIIDRILPSSLMLFDESFCSTNEKEGSKIALDITRALLESKVDVISVTHLYVYAKTLYDEQNPRYAFLRAERLPDGTRTKRVISGEPLPTSFGLDVYHEVFRHE